MKEKTFHVGEPRDEVVESKMALRIVGVESDEDVAKSYSDLTTIDRSTATSVDASNQIKREIKTYDCRMMNRFLRSHPGGDTRGMSVSSKVGGERDVSLPAKAAAKH